ncbi:MAG: hypothetical protein J3K34DRAFT_480869, partial [Monoraphidium minutum]
SLLKRRTSWCCSGAGACWPHAWGAAAGPAAARQGPAAAPQRATSSCCDAVEGYRLQVQFCETWLRVRLYLRVFASILIRPRTLDAMLSLIRSQGRLQGVAGCARRAMWGRADRTDPDRQLPPALNELDARDDARGPPLHAPRPPGGAGAVVEPTVAHPGGVLAPEPSDELKRAVPIAKVTTDTDVIAPPDPSDSFPSGAPMGHGPRS